MSILDGKEKLGAGRLATNHVYELISDKQFERVYISAGAWFVGEFMEVIMTNIDQFNKNKDAKIRFIEKIYNNGKGPDKNMSGTRVRVYCVMKIINAGRSVEALEKVVSSNRVAKSSPEAFKIAKEFLMNLNIEKENSIKI